MAESTSNQTKAADKTWKRRGLFAAAWAAVIGVVLRETSKPVEAAASLQFADTTTTVTNTAAGPTVLLASDVSYTTTSASVFTGQTIVSSAMAGLQGVAGLRGPAPMVCGVFGQTGRAAPTAGVIGDATGSSAGTGVLGQSFDGIGVIGQSKSATGVFGGSTSGAGVYGQIPATSNANAIAIYGQNASTYTGPVAGTGGYGVVGVSRYGHGVLGATSASGAGAVVGATNGIAGAWAGIFFGPAIVEGDFTVLGGAKSAAVPHPDGTHRRLYCMESPESWFEDFGESELACGQADVAIDPDFAAVADLGAYHVFITAYGDFDLRVSKRGSEGFRVQAKDGTASGRFSWRVVAKRKDIAALRFETVTVPPALVMPSVPAPVAPPVPSDR
jgi:hypothetical protein